MAQINVDGRVKWYNRTLGYGFISTRETPSRDVFVHHSAIRLASQEQSNGKYLVQGEYVTVELAPAEQNEKGHTVTVTNLQGFQGDKLICELERRRPTKQTTEGTEQREPTNDGFTTVKRRAARAPRNENSYAAKVSPAQASAPAAVASTTSTSSAPAIKSRGRPRKTGPMPSQ